MSAVVIMALTHFELKKPGSSSWLDTIKESRALMWGIFQRAV